MTRTSTVSWNGIGGGLVSVCAKASAGRSMSRAADVLFILLSDSA
jgi:hypothetical protein